MDLRFELPLSSRVLVWLFALLLLLFLAVRWQPVGMVKAAIDDFATAAGINIKYDTLHLSGLTLEAEGLVISPQGAAGETLRFERAVLSPAWGQLVTGQPAANLRFVYNGMDGAATLILREQLLGIESVTASGQVAALSPLLRFQVPIQLSGELALHGRMEIDMVGRVATAAQFDVQWQDAVVSGLGSRIDGGSYAAAIALQEPNVWRWQVDGGAALSVKGEGIIRGSAGPLQSWHCSGSAQLLNQGEQPLLSALLPKGRQMNFNLSGTLGSPRFMPDKAVSQ